MTGGAQRCPRRILVVEDEAMICVLIEDMLAELGYEVAAAPGRIDQALTAIDQIAFDLAILDVNVEGQTTASVADALAARGTPFVFATGYAEQALPEHHRERPTLVGPARPHASPSRGHSSSRTSAGGIVPLARRAAWKSCRWKRWPRRRCASERSSRIWSFPTR